MTLPPRMALSLVLLLPGAREASAAAADFDGTLIETIASHTFAEQERSDLVPDDGGAVRLWIPRIHPTAQNAPLDWLTRGPDGRHPMLDGRWRYDVYKPAIIEWLAGSRDAGSGDVVARAEALLAGVEPTTTFDEVALRLRQRAAALEPHVRDELVATLEDLAPWGDGIAVEAAVENGTLPVLVASALHHGRVFARVERARALVSESVLAADPAFMRAFDAAEQSIRRRRQRMRLVIEHKTQSHIGNADDATLRSTRVALLPVVAVARAFPDFTSAERLGLGFDYLPPIDRPVSTADFLTVDASLIAFTTMERALFGGRRFEKSCPEEDAHAWNLRAYLGRCFFARLEALHGALDPAFFTQQLDWEAGGASLEAFRELARSRREMLDAALAACSTAAALTPEVEAPRTGTLDPGLDRLVGWMTGSFSSAEQAASDSAYFDIRLEMAPIWPERSDGHWLYVEQAAEAHPERPYRQRVYRVRRAEGGLVSEVFTLPAPEAFVGAHADPDRFEILEPDSLLARSGCSVFLRWVGDHYEGGTIGRECVSTLSGASHATSEVAVYEDRIVSWDRGFDAEGEQVWGARGAGYVFRKLRRPGDR